MACRTVSYRTPPEDLPMPRPLPGVAAFLLLTPALPAAWPTLDLTRAVVVAPPGLAGPEATAVRMLVEEVEKRSLVRWERAEKLPAGDAPAVVVGPAAAVRDLLAGRANPAPPGPEGYDVGTAGPVVWVAGHDPRGTLFGVGRLLREL